LDQYDIERAKTKFGFPKDKLAPTKSASESADIVGVSASTVKASSGHSKNPANPTTNQPLGSAFNATPASVDTTKPVISQTRSGHSVPKQAARVSLGPTQPPLTATQGLQSSSLFQLSAFAASSKNPVVVNTAKMAVEKITHDENVPPIDFDALDAARPGTSSGIPPSTVGKRNYEALRNHNQQARTMHNLNPYAPS
jgi:hypothetical protein